jgi:hypothetical protein
MQLSQTVVMMAGWYVDAGESEARVGETWDATL